jgi:hypothetical protein
VFNVSTSSAATVSVSFSAQVGGSGTVSLGGNTSNLTETKPAIGLRPLSVPAGSLAEDTGYRYALTARTAAGRACTSKGTFHTQQRSTSLHLSHVVVNNDSDDWGNGELTFDGFIHGQWYCQMDGSMYNLDLGDGDAIDTNVWIGQQQVPSSFDVAISVHDDDVDPVILLDGGTCGMAGDGSDDNFDWSTAEATIVSTPCLCASQTFPVLLSTPGIPWVEMQIEVTVAWP